MIPLLRGGAKPVLDKPVSVAPPSEEVTPQAQTQLCLPHSDDLADTDSGESDAGAAPELQDDTEVPVIQAASADCLFLLNTTSSIAHVAAVCDESDPYRVVTVDAGKCENRSSLLAMSVVQPGMLKLFQLKHSQKNLGCA